MGNGKKYSWTVVGLLWGVALLNYMDRQMLSTMRPAMQTSISELGSATRFGYLMAVFLWVYGLMSPLSGIFADKFNRKKIIIWSLFVWSGVTFGMGFATTFNQLYILRAVMGCSEALYLPAGLSLIADYHKDNSRSLAIGVHMTGLYLGQAIGGFGATLAAAFSWHTAFFLFGIVGMSYAGVLGLFLKECRGESGTRNTPSHYPSTDPPVWKGLALLLTNISFWILLFYFAISSLPGWAVKNWLPTLFAQSLGIPMAQAGPLSTVTIAASSFGGVLLGGYVSDRWVATNFRGRMYTSALGLGLTIPALILLGLGHSIGPLVLAAVLFGTGYGLFDANNMPILCQVISRRTRATAYGIMNMTGVFAGAAITEIFGRSFDRGNLGRDFGMLAAIVLLAIFVQLFFLRPVGRDTNQQDIL